MKKLNRTISLLLIFSLLVIVISSCSSKTIANQGTRHSKSSYSKKNKNYYHQRFSYKPRSVRKDYVIKNGIAN